MIISFYYFMSAPFFPMNMPFFFMNRLGQELGLPLASYQVGLAELIQPALHYPRNNAPRKRIAFGHPSRFALPKRLPLPSATRLFYFRHLGEYIRHVPKTKQPLAKRVAFVARPGFEPRHTEPKSVVLPLYYQAIRPFFWNGLQK